MSKTRPYPPVYPPLFFFAQFVFRILARLWVKKITVEGLENIPKTGAMIYVVNHMSMLDTPAQALFFPRPVHLLAAEKYEKHVISLILNIAGSIYINRGEVDRKSLKQALAVLEDGHILALAAEGTRSDTNQLAEGRSGAAYLATRANVPIVPGVAWGTENMINDLKRFRRTESVHIKIGKPFTLPNTRARSDELRKYTEEIMLALARLLPEEYHGYYAEQIALEQSSVKDTNLLDKV